MVTSLWDRREKIDPDKVIAVGKLESEFIVISLLLLFTVKRFCFEI